MNTIQIEKVLIDMKTGQKTTLVATVASQPSNEHHIYSLTYEGYRSDWKVKQ